MHDNELVVWRREFAAEIIGESPAIVDALETVRHVATTDCSILISGETGSGKELFARASHRASRRRGKPFIAVNCAALPESLLETELFGHLKGSFTGATTSRAGRFVSANEGTIFLDEIGDLPLASQAKLLRVLEERVVTPVGSDCDIPVNVRIIAATHRNLEDMVAQGTFRADLYFRLAVVPLHLPPLRDRAGDLDLVANRCLEKAIERAGRPIEGFDASARAAMHAYAWPGNARELAHRVERAVLLAKRSRIGGADLALPGIAVAQHVVTRTEEIAPLARGSSPEIPAVDETSLDLRHALEALERTLIDRALTKAGGNRTEAAALLGLNRTTLVEKLRKYA